MAEKTTNRFGDTVWLNSKGQWHNENGPAIERTDGTKMWYLNGERHREDGPAIIWFNGDAWWFWYDVEMPFDEWLEKNIQISDEDKTLLKLKYG